MKGNIVINLKLFNFYPSEAICCVKLRISLLQKTTSFLQKIIE